MNKQDLTSAFQGNKIVVLLGALLVVCVIVCLVLGGMYLNTQASYTPVHDVFVDVNGDGNVDLVKDGSVIFNGESNQNLSDSQAEQ